MFTASQKILWRVSRPSDPTDTDRATRYPSIAGNLMAARSPNSWINLARPKRTL